jgi:hypothetical protein
LKKLAFLFIFITISSCQFFENQPTSENELLQKQLKDINWKTVDQAPSIVQCDSFVNVFEKKDCFFRFFTDEIKSKLNGVNFTKFYPKNAILNIKVSVVPEHELFFEADISKDSIALFKPQIDSILSEKLIDFPAVSPAMKQGVYVKSVFFIPYKVTK